MLMEHLEQKIKAYSELLVRAGGNVQPNQPVVVTCDIADAYFARLVRDAAYDAGASEVQIFWSDDDSARTWYVRAAETSFDEYPAFYVERYRHYDEKGAVYLHIDSSDPDLLQGVAPERIQRYTKVSRMGRKTHSANTMSNKNRWSLLAIPQSAWAKRVFPDKSASDAAMALWEHIFKAVRIDGGECPLAVWEAHRQTFEKRLQHLNGKQYESLRFTTGLGTDFTMGLPQRHVWSGGGDVGQDGVPYFPNLPTEELFTAPHRLQTNGTVVAAMPLSYMGSLIEDFRIDFKDGRVSSFSAGKNEAILKSIIEMDEGSHYLGEVALVANTSPLAQMQTLFYNTLYDENASAHLALGKAYPKCIENSEKLSEKALLNAGINDSLIHVDFMFGTADMKVVGVKDGREEVLMEDGDFVF